MRTLFPNAGTKRQTNLTTQALLRERRLKKAESADAVKSDNPTLETNEVIIDKPSSNLPRMLSLKKVSEYTTFSSSTIYDMMDENSKRYDPTFPKQVQLSQKRVAWVESEICDWLNKHINARTV